MRPHAWISSEWFSPDNTPGIAIPFYLAHPRLMRLEQKMIIDVEGGTWSGMHAHSAPRSRAMWCSTPISCIAAAAGSSCSARRRRRYPRYYRPNPASRHFVQHLRLWYAQSHPDEDFAETFAVWLRPRSNWRTRYAGWPALKKLEYVDELMAEIAGAAPLLTRRERVDPLSQLTQTLAEHYEKKQALYAFETPKTYDRDLLRCSPPIRGIAGRRRLRRSSGATARRSGRWLRSGRANTSSRSMPCSTT